MDSTSEGVHARNIQKMYFQDNCAIHVLRFRKAIDPNIMAKAISFVRAQTATPYTTGEAMQSVVAPLGKGTARQFCSRLVARAYAHAGVQLVANPHYCTPAQILNSKKLIEISNVTEWASNEQAEEVQRTDATIGMRKVTIAFIEAVRGIAPDVMNVNDAIRLSINSPEYDSKIYEALQKSGYLDYWRVEQINFPWRHDIVDMVRLQNSDTTLIPEIRAYCNQTIASDAAGEFSHWNECLKALQDTGPARSNMTIQAMIDLYIHLNIQHHMRIKTATIWLKWRENFPI